MCCARSFCGCARRRRTCPRLFDYLSGKKNVSSCQILGGEADDDDSFVDIMSGINVVGDAESEGWTC